MILDKMQDTDGMVLENPSFTQVSPEMDTDEKWNVSTCLLTSG